MGKIESDSQEKIDSLMREIAEYEELEDELNVEMFDLQVRVDNKDHQIEKLKKQLEEYKVTQSTLRDTFASYAMQSLIGAGGGGIVYIASKSYKMADQMLKVREEEGYANEETD